MTSQLSRQESKISWIYIWLLLSSIITVPWSAINLFAANRITLESTFSAIIWPTLLHLIVMGWQLRSSNLFIRRHTQQAFLLVGLRFLLTLMFVGAEMIVFWFLLNGAVWMGGTIWGVRQVKQGECWLMRRRSEADLLPSKRKPEPEPDQKENSGQESDGQRGLPPSERSQRVAQWLAIFRSGSIAEREMALAQLKLLDEVELF